MSKRKKKHRKLYGTGVPCPQCVQENITLGKLELVQEMLISKVSSIKWDGNELYFQTAVEQNDFKKLKIKCNSCSYSQELKDAQGIKDTLEPWIEFCVENKMLKVEKLPPFKQTKKKKSKKVLVLQTREENDSIPQEVY